MIRNVLCVLSVAISANILFASSVADKAVLKPDGDVALGAYTLKPTLFASGWRCAAAAGGQVLDGSGIARFRFEIDGRKIAEASVSLKQLPQGKAKLDYTVTAVDGLDVQSLGYSMALSSVEADGGRWFADETQGVFAHCKGNSIKLGRGRCRSFALRVADGSEFRFTSSKGMEYLVQDERRWSDGFMFRFGDLTARKLPESESMSISVVVSAKRGLSVVRASKCVIQEGAQWMRFEHAKDVLPGSALDFSMMGLQDAPAGKYGWLRAVGGHFEFERKPDVEQRFYGANLCFSANYLSHEDADMLIDRLIRFGYNTLRIHHHDGAWFASDVNRERLDYLIAQSIKKGIYITTDLYVSRPVKWRNIGIDRDGTIDSQLYKTYIGVWEGAFRDWCKHAKAFLEHVNPYTGRAYKDEPGLPLISLVNEGSLRMNWRAKRNDAHVLAAWKEYGGRGSMPSPWAQERRGEFYGFDAWLNTRIWRKCSAFVRSLGAKAMLSNDNEGPCHGDGDMPARLYDYVDNHFYVDHPRFLGKDWELPSKCANRNPIACGEPRIFSHGWAKGASKPYTVTEWNFSGPGRYRGIGGILTGAMAAEQEWDGLWRFAYSHSNKKLKDNPHDSPGYFDCATDPLIAASERAGVCLYLRRDTAPGALKINKGNGSMTLVSARTCGGFTEADAIDAGPLTFRVLTDADTGRAVPTTLWVSSIDGKPIPSSSRMLLTHLTDIQGNGSIFEDETRTVLLKRGVGHVVEISTAEVVLRVKEPRKYHIWSLAADGKRRFEIPSGVENGVLCFTVSTRGADSKGVLQYEIAY